MTDCSPLKCSIEGKNCDIACLRRFSEFHASTLLVNKVNLSSFLNHGCVVAVNCVTRMQTRFSANRRPPTKLCYGEFNLIAVIKRPASFLI